MTCLCAGDRWFNDRRYALFVKEYVANYSAMTDTQAGSLVRGWIGADEEATKLRQSWIPKFEQLLGAKKPPCSFRLIGVYALMIERTSVFLAIAAGSAVASAKKDSAGRRRRHRGLFRRHCYNRF